MAIKKQQKRSIEEVQSVPAQNGPANKKLQKPAKKMKVEKPVQAPAPSNGVQAKKAAKVEKKKNKGEQKPKIEIPAEVLEAKNAAKRLKNAEKMKKKNENRALARKEQGQYKFEKINLTPEALEIRIKDIESRPELTKTARRRLVQLKKKLQFTQGTFVPKPKTETPNDDTPKLSKNKRRALRKKKEAEKRRAEGESADSKTQAVEKTNKKGAAVVKAEAVKQGKNVKVAGKKPQLKAKEAKKIILKKEEPEDSEEEDDEEEEDDSDDEADVSNGTLNTTEEQDDDDDEEDDEEEEDEEEDDEEDEEEDEDEEEEEEVKIPVKKVKKEQEKQQPAKKEFKKEPAQNGDAGKKKRFVLFVGNLPFTATAEDIKKHFLTKVSAVTDVRVPPKPGTTTPRGFAYVEVSNQTDYEKGLSLQGSILDGRRLKVEYTQGGSKSAGNRQDVISKNKKLHAMRKQGMLAGSQKDGHKRNDRRQKQRHQGPA